MSKMVEDAHQAISEPEVQDMIRRLADYGLGVFLPHMHTETEDFAPLPSGIVQVEENLQVVFRPVDDEMVGLATAVGWRWDMQAQAVTYCTACVESQSNGHLKYKSQH